jgi:hypothetical protein
LICLGAKRIETRSWKSWYHGEILIHAAKTYPRWARECEKQNAFYQALRPDGVYSNPKLMCGHIIGAVTVGDCIRTEALRDDISEEELLFGDFSDNRFGWLLTSPRFLPKPFFAKGALGLWEFDANLLYEEHTA